MKLLIFFLLCQQTAFFQHTALPRFQEDNLIFKNFHIYICVLGVIFTFTYIYVLYIYICINTLHTHIYGFFKLHITSHLILIVNLKIFF